MLRPRGPERDQRESIRKASLRYILLGLSLLLLSLILSVALIGYLYVRVERSYPGLSYALDEGSTANFSLTDVPEDYIVSLNYSVSSTGNPSDFEMYFIFLDEYGEPFKSEKVVFEGNRSVGAVDIHSRLQGGLLLISALRSCRGEISMRISYLARPWYYNMLSLFNMVASLVGMGAALKGVAYYLIYKLGEQRPRRLVH